MTDTIETTVEAPRLKGKYSDQVVPALQEQFGYGNAMQVPLSLIHISEPTRPAA